MKNFKKVQHQKPAILVVMFFFAFLITSNVKAQNVLVKGIVKGATIFDTEILKGANILLKGTKAGTSTNKKGEFTFPQKLKIGDVLVFTHLGYFKKYITIDANSTNLNVILKEDDNQMLGAVNTNKRYKSKHPK